MEDSDPLLNEGTFGSIEANSTRSGINTQRAITVSLSNNTSGKAQLNDPPCRRLAKTSGVPSLTLSSFKLGSQVSSNYTEFSLLLQCSRATMKMSWLVIHKEWISLLALLLFICISMKKTHFGSWYRYYANTSSATCSISYQKVPFACFASNLRSSHRYTCLIYMSIL